MLVYVELFVDKSREIANHRDRNESREPRERDKERERESERRVEYAFRFDGRAFVPHVSNSHGRGEALKIQADALWCS